MTEDDLRLVHSLAEKEGAVEAPTDLNLADTQQIELPDLEWRHYDNPPIKLVVTNTGHTVNVGGKWECNRSYIRDGPFKGNYVFAQMHFHWGPTDDTGSEHSVENRKLPLEMHVVHINRMYRSQEMALKEKDGVAIVTYLFEIQEEDNMDIEPIISALPLVSLPQTSTQISPVSIGSLLLQFQRDYLLYWGSVSSPSCQHVILWLTCRTPLGISSQQLAKFRQVRDVNGQFVVKNYRETHARRNHTLLHVSPSSKLESTLLSVYPGHAKVQEQLKQQEERLAEEVRKTAAEEPAESFIAEEPSEKTEPLPSLDAEAAAEAVSEAKAAEDAQAAAEAAVESVSSAAPPYIPATGQPSGAPVASPTTQPSGARVTALPSGDVLPNQTATQSDLPVANVSGAPTDAPAQEVFPEEGTEGIQSQPSTMTTAKLYGAPSNTYAGRECVVKVDASQTDRTETGTRPKTSAAPSKTGSILSKTPSKAMPSKTSSVRSGPMVESKSPGPGASLHSSVSKGFTTVTYKLSSERVPSQKGLPKQGDISNEVQEGAECIQPAQPLQKNKTKSDLRVTLSETPMEQLLDDETQEGVSTTEQPSHIVLSEKVSAAETGSGTVADAGLVCPPCPPCSTEVPPEAPSEVPQEVPFDPPEDDPSPPEEPALESTTEVPCEQPPEFEPEEQEVPLEQPPEPEPEEQAGVLCEQPPELQPDVEAESPFDQPLEPQPQEAETSCEQPPEMQPEEPEVPPEQTQDIPPEEQLEIPHEEPQDICPYEPGEISLEEPSGGQPELPEPADRVSVCTPVTLPGVSGAPVDGSKTTIQGPCVPCPSCSACPPCPPCPPCPKCGAIITREEEQDLPGECPPQCTGTDRVTGQTDDPTGRPTPQKVKSGECPPGFTKVKTISGAQKCPSGYKEVSALVVKGNEECPPGYVPVSAYEPTPITKPVSLEPGTPGRTRSSAQDKFKSSRSDRNFASKGSGHVGVASSQRKQAEECPTGFVKVSSRPRAPSGGTTRPSRSRSNTEITSDSPTGTPPPRVSSGVSVGRQSGASRNQSAEVIASVNAVPSDECPPNSVSMPRSSAARVPSEKASTTQPKRAIKSQASVRQVSAAANISSDVGSATAVSPSQRSSQMQENKSVTALFIKAGGKCPPGYVLAPKTAGTPSRSQTGGRNEPISVRSEEECPPGYVKVVPSQSQTPDAGLTDAPSRNSQMKSNKGPVYVKPGEECPPGYERVIPVQSQSQAPHKGPTLAEPRTSQMQSNAPAPIKGQSKITQGQSNKPIYVKPGEECPPGYERVIPPQGQTPLPGRSETQSKTSQIKNKETVYVKSGEECPPGVVRAKPTQNHTSEAAPTEAQSKISQQQSNQGPVYVKAGEECPPGYVRAEPTQNQTSGAAPNGAQSKISQQQSNHGPVYVKAGEECPPGYVIAEPTQSQTSGAAPNGAQSTVSQQQSNQDPVYVKAGEECPPGYVRAEPTQSQSSGAAPNGAQSTVSQQQSNQEPVYVKAGEECPPGYVRAGPTQNQTSGAAPNRAQSTISQQQSNQEPVYVKAGEECPPGYVREETTQSQSSGAAPNGAQSTVSQQQSNQEPIYVKAGEECPPGYVRAGPTQNQTSGAAPNGAQSTISQQQSNQEPVYVKAGEECPPGYVREETTQSQSSGAAPNGAQSTVSQQQSNQEPVYVKAGEECPPGYVRAEPTQNQTSGAAPNGAQSKISQQQSNQGPVYVKAGEECPPGYVREETTQSQSSGAAPNGAQSTVSQQQSKQEPVYVKAGEECPPGYVRAQPRKKQTSGPAPNGAQSQISQQQSNQGPVYVKAGEECPPGYVRAEPTQNQTSGAAANGAQSTISQQQSNQEPVYVKAGEECPPGYVRAEPTQNQTSGAAANGAQSTISQQQSNQEPVYVKAGEECPPGYVRAEPRKKKTSGAAPNGTQSKKSQQQSNQGPVYVRAGEECPPGYIPVVPSKSISPVTAPTKAKPKTSQVESRKEPIYMKPGEECPPGYVRSSPPESVALETQVSEGVDANAPIYIKEGDECPPGYARVAPERSTLGRLAKSMSRTSRSKTNLMNMPVYEQASEECSPGYVKAAPTLNVTDGRKVNQVATASTPALPSPNGTAPAGVSETQGSELPEYVKPGKNCPPSYAKATPSQAKAPSQRPSADPFASSQTQGEGNDTPKVEQSALAKSAVSTIGSLNQSTGAAKPIYVKSGEYCPLGNVRAPLSGQGSAQAPSSRLHLQGSKSEAPEYIRPGEESSPIYTQALPTQGVSSEAKSQSQPLFDAPGEECPPGYVKSVAPSKVGGSRAPLQSITKTPSKALRDDKGEAGKTMEPPQTVHVKPGEACPSGYQNAGNSQTKAQPSDRNKTFAIRANEQCPEGYIKVCENKNGPGHHTDGKAPEVQSGRKSVQKPSSKSSPTKPRRGAESPQTPGSKVCSDEQLSLGKRPGERIRGRSGSRGSRPKQGEIFTDLPQGAYGENTSASPNIQLNRSNTSQCGNNDGSHNSAGTQNYESNIEPTKPSSERMRKLNIYRTSSSGRVAAQDECEEVETLPSRKSSGRSNVRKSDTIRSFTEEEAFDNRSLSYDECPSRRSVNSSKGLDGTPCRGLSCIDTVGELAISERELMSEVSSFARRSRSRLEATSSSRFQVEGDNARVCVKINEMPRRMDGSAEPSQQSLGRAVSSVKVASLAALSSQPEDDQRESAVPAVEPTTDDAPTETALEQVLADSKIRSAEGDEQEMDPVVGSMPVSESGEGAQLDEEVLMSMRDAAFHSVGLLEPPPEAKAVSEMAMPEEVGGGTSPEGAPVEAGADKSLVAPTTGQHEIVMTNGTSNALVTVPEALPMTREESARKFKYFQPPIEPQRPAPVPVFFNSLAVTPVVILPASMEPNSMKTKKSPKYGSKINLPCGGNVPCHGKARKLWEQEREQWVKEESSKVLLKETSIAFQALPEKLRSELAAEAARRRKSERGPLGPEYDIPDKRGWPFEPYESEAPLMSPIDIVCQCVVDRLLAPLTFEGHFFPLARSLITNTGESVEIRTVDPNCTPVLHGGPLLDDYIFESMHFHWSQGPGADCLGGTHRVNGRRFCMEGHMIHFKSEFKSKAEALKHVGGICCVAFMLQIGGMENGFFGRMSQELYRISAPKSKAVLDFNALQTFAGRACPFGYITYPGTLVGRDDPVNVIWIVYTEPIDICCQNVTQFQRLRPPSTSDIPPGCVPAVDVAKRPVLRACGPVV